MEGKEFALPNANTCSTTRKFKNTIFNQFKKFDENGNIDKSKSEYFDFELRKDTLKNIFSGKVTYYNILDYKLM